MKITVHVDLDFDSAIRDDTWSFQCFVSPEVMSHIGLKQTLIHVNNKTLVLTEDASVKKNCVAFQSPNRFGPKVTLESSQNQPLLKSVTLSVPSPDTDIEHIQDALNQVLATSPRLIPVSEKTCLRARIKAVDSDWKLLVTRCEPYCTGLITSETKILLIQAKAKSLNEVTSEKKDLCSYTMQFLQNQHKLGVLRDVSYPFQVMEMPSILAQRLIGSKDLILATTLFGNLEHSPSETGFFSLQSSCGKAIVVQFCASEELEPGTLFASSTLIHYIKTSFDEDCLQFQLSPISSNAVIPKASEAVIAMIATPALDSLSVKEIDDIIKTFFERNRYLMTGSVVEVRSEVDSEINGVWFKVLKLAKDGKSLPAALVNNHVTTVFQKTTLTEPLPSVTVKASKINTKILPLLPPHLNRIKDQVTKSKATSLILAGKPGSGSTLISQALAKELGFAITEVDTCLIVSDGSGTTEAKLRQSFAQALTKSYSIMILKNADRIATNREGRLDFRVLDHFKTEVRDRCNPKALMIAECETLKKVDKKLAEVFELALEVTEPTDLDRVECLKYLIEDFALHLDEDVSVQDIGRKCSGFNFADLEYLIRRTLSFTISRHDASFASFGPKTSQNDFEKALEEVQKRFADSIGAPKIPSVKWDDVGGLEDAKREIMEAIELPIKHPELADHMRRSGILMYGPPGVGKTLLAKAVATECSLNFLSVKGPELLNMYVGQSEENVREVFVRAKAASPCVVFFDELDSLAPNRGRSGDSGGVMDRVVSQLLAELDEVSEGGLVFVIGATNRPDLIDPALLRPGRFDRLVYLGIAKDPEHQKPILESLMRKFTLSPDLGVNDVVTLLPVGQLTGADLYSIVSEANLNAIARKIRELERGSSGGDKQVTVELQDFVQALADFHPSVSASDLASYESIRDSIQASDMTGISDVKSHDD